MKAHRIGGTNANVLGRCNMRYALCKAIAHKNEMEYTYYVATECSECDRIMSEVLERVESKRDTRHVVVG